uniref:Uncharacterized protein n=1 Tax=Magallana gigas TaxID=29159 RepID=A0A8W8NRF1_MAGGI
MRTSGYICEDPFSIFIIINSVLKLKDSSENVWEAELVKTRIAACDLERNVRQIVTTTQKKIEDAAARYMEDIITASHFLKVCGSIYAGVFDV